MGFMGQLYEHHSIVLLIVLLQIQLELFGIARVYRSRHPVLTYLAKYLNILCHLSLDTLPFMLTYFFWVFCAGKVIRMCLYRA